MTYKDSGLTRGELGNVPAKNPIIECSDERCARSVRAQDSAADEWLLEADPDIPVLCPDCAEETPTHRLTPTDARREQNRSLIAFAEGDDQ